MIHVLAIITTEPGRRAAVLAHFADNRPHVLAEPGCIEYAAAIDFAPALGNQAALGPDTFAVIEKWASREALEAHFRAPHMAAYAERVRGMIAGRAIHVLSPA